MISVTDKHQCCGCGACVQRCPKQCITLQADSEGFLYPCVDADACIDCGLCEKVCPFIHPYEERKPKEVLAAINKDEEVRLQSSSGGIFTLLAESVIDEGGVVFGARYDEDWQVTLDYTEIKAGLATFRGSKYVQARTGETYKQCEQFLKEGRKVLYAGTPCQIAGLKHFLRKDYDNLLTIDIVCHGVPSPKVWGRYLDEIKDKSNLRIESIEFRNKTYDGWKKFNFVISYQEGLREHTIHTPFYSDPYMKAFLGNLDLRPSCHSCQANANRSHSDITIADFWGIERHLPAMDDDKGTGLVLINTEKGKAALDLSKVLYQPTTYETAVKDNPPIFKSVAPHPNRASFFKKLDKSSSLITLIEQKLQPTFVQKFQTHYRRLKAAIGRRVRFRQEK